MSIIHSTHSTQIQTNDIANAVQCEPRCQEHVSSLPSNYKFVLFVPAALPLQSVTEVNMKCSVLALLAVIGTAAAGKPSLSVSFVSRFIWFCHSGWRIEKATKCGFSVRLSRCLRSYFCVDSIKIKFKIHPCAESIKVTKMALLHDIYRCR